ncbi:spore germination protein KA [Anaerobacterium chartisolvens]|uniref:Spore germination protein KA n=1 Tax=Anaerobacterium chartisolvens TaxID=1297424 RepID=A0A369BFT2_9FIRM|nr:spore germination protein [Anaerobacterium chartisolvens]RCX19426.1 spore germination protein KA [Anaerobacterium chartisolvens]
MEGYKKIIKKLLFFNEPKKMERFVLKETSSKENRTEDSAENNAEKDKQYRARRRKEPGGIRKIDRGTDESSKKEKEIQKEDENKRKDSEVSVYLSHNLTSMKRLYNIPMNGDVVIREFDIILKDRAVGAFIIFFDGMTDRKVINNNILQPLMMLSSLEIKKAEEDIAEYIKKQILPHNQMKEFTSYRKIMDEVNFGGCAIFVDGIAKAFTGDVKGWEHRGVERPNTELVIRGPQEGFTETIRTNTALIRKRLKDEDLICQNFEIGERSNTPCSMMYIKDIANESLVEEVAKRLKSLKVDYLSDSGELEQFIEDSSFLPAPQIIATERPDRVATALTEGRVAVIMHGSPFVLIMPITAEDMVKSPEDNYVRFPYGNLFRLIRYFGIALSLLLPGLYIAITNYHQEMIPTDLLFSIEAAREMVPFPSVIEILIMEIAFELIREAGIRIPGPIGPTLGIIGALILGQAAVAANIVSPVLIIIVAVTGIGSFAAPNFSLAFSFRILRFAFIIIGAMAGFLGITTGLFIYGMWLVSAKSFGVPFLVPFGPKTANAFTDSILRAPIWKQERRPDYLNPKDDRRQAPISRGWMDNGSKGEDEDEQ